MAARAPEASEREGAHFRTDRAVAVSDVGEHHRCGCSDPGGERSAEALVRGTPRLEPQGPLNRVRDRHAVRQDARRERTLDPGCERRDAALVVARRSMIELGEPTDAA
jgi:hypothetical protein